MRQESMVSNANRKSCCEVEEEQKEQINCTWAVPENQYRCEVEANYQETVCPVERV
jgi:hypothetical protein